MARDASNGADETNAVRAFIELVKKLSAEKYRIDPQVAEDVVVKLLESNKETGLSDEDLENLTGHRQSVIRKVLRMLHDELKVATYRRGRHPQTKAARYYWTLDPDRINIMLYNLKKTMLEKLRSKLEYEEQTDFYVCPRCKVRYTVDEAFEFEFKCPRCGAILEEDDKEVIVSTLRAIVDRLEEEIRRDARKIFTGGG